MGAQPDTSTSAPDVWHGIQQILAQIPVAAHLATYLVPLHSDYDRLSVGGTVRSQQANTVWSRPQHVAAADPDREPTSLGLVASRPPKRHHLFKAICNGVAWATGHNHCVEVLVHLAGSGDSVGR